MKAKHLSVAIAALLAAAALWLAWTRWRAHTVDQSSASVAVKSPRGKDVEPSRAAPLPGASQTNPTAGSNSSAKPRHTLRPPDPTRKFREFTPEERVKFARKGHGPGG